MKSILNQWYDSNTQSKSRKNVYEAFLVDGIFLYIIMKANIFIAEVRINSKIQIK